jgi:hypothetical protein
LIEAGVGKAFVQPVFVTNKGFGGPGGDDKPPAGPPAPGGKGTGGEPAEPFKANEPFKPSEENKGSRPTNPLLAFAGLLAATLKGDTPQTGTSSMVSQLTKAIVSGNTKLAAELRASMTPDDIARALSNAKIQLDDAGMFSRLDQAQKEWARKQLTAADTTSERIGTLHSQLASANATLEQIERNRIAVTLKNVATTIVRISANEVNRAQTTFKVYNSGSAGKFAL